MATQRVKSQDDTSLLATLVDDEADATEAFGALYDRHAASVQALAMQVMNDKEAAAEITRATFEECWRRAAGYRNEHGSVQTWLLDIAHTIALNRRRQRDRDLPPASETGAKRRTTRKRSQASAPTATTGLESLPEDTQTIIRMAYFEGRTPTSVAISMGMPVRKVKTVIRNALDELREQYATPATEPETEVSLP